MELKKGTILLFKKSAELGLVKEINKDFIVIIYNIEETCYDVITVPHEFVTEEKFEKVA